MRQRVDLRPGDGSYALIHLVVQEIEKGLIETQVVDHMEVQATSRSDDGPSYVSVLFVEALRTVLHPRTLARVRMLARRAPHVDVRLGPHMGRLGMRRNAVLLARKVRRAARGLPIVFHCRGESAGLWAIAMRSYLSEAAVVVDMRGIWPEEFLLTRGYETVESAIKDPSAMSGYQGALERLRGAVRNADALLAVSAPLVDWLDRHVERRPPAQVVPCCVSEVAHNAGARHLIRSRLGIEGKVVLCYVGTAAPYQKIEDGFARFCAVAVGAKGAERVHALCITPDVDGVRATLLRSGVPTSALTVIHVPQAAVADYIAAADAGFLLRDNTEVNRVSVPVKLGEYLAAGVPVVISSALEWNELLLEGSPAAIAIGWFGTPAALQAREVDRVLATLTGDPDRFRAHALSLAQKRFTWAGNMGRVREAYHTALQRSSAASGPSIVSLR